jgi:Tfp pilus assembly protein PilO
MAYREIDEIDMSKISKIAAIKIWVKEYWFNIALVLALVVGFGYLVVWSDNAQREDDNAQREHDKHQQSAPCSEFANTPMKDVPLRCANKIR